MWERQGLERRKHANEGKWSGHIFNDRRFGQWRDYLSRAIDLGIRLTQINMMQWKLAKPSSLICQVCHSHTNINLVERFEHGGIEMKRFRCSNCGNEFAIRETGETGNSFALYLDGQSFYIHQPE